MLLSTDDLVQCDTIICSMLFIQKCTKHNEMTAHIVQYVQLPATLLDPLRPLYLPMYSTRPTGTEPASLEGCHQV